LPPVQTQPAVPQIAEHKEEFVSVSSTIPPEINAGTNANQTIPIQQDAQFLQRVEPPIQSVVPEEKVLPEHAPMSIPEENKSQNFVADNTAGFVPQNYQIPQNVAPPNPIVQQEVPLEQAPPAPVIQQEAPLEQIPPQDQVPKTQDKDYFSAAPGEYAHADPEPGKEGMSPPKHQAFDLGEDEDQVAEGKRERLPSDYDVTEMELIHQREQADIQRRAMLEEKERDELAQKKQQQEQAEAELQQWVE